MSRSTGLLPTMHDVAAAAGVSQATVSLLILDAQAAEISTGDGVLGLSIRPEGGRYTVAAGGRHTVHPLVK